MSLRIFVAHAPKDARHFQALYEFLTRLGYFVWRDPAPSPEAEWRPDIDEAIQAANLLIVILTPASAVSPQVTYEWAYALGQGIRVMPITFQATRAHARLLNLERYDMTAFKVSAQFWDYFRHELARVTQLISSAPSPTPPANYGMGASAPPSTYQAQAPQMPAPAPALSPTPQMPYVDRSVMPDKTGHWLVIRRGPTSGAFMFRLQGEIINLGRDAGNDIVIEHGELSRNHLRFIWKQSGYAVRDMGSTNGTRLNGVPIAGETMMPAGAILQIGENVILSYEVV